MVLIELEPGWVRTELGELASIIGATLGAASTGPSDRAGAPSFFSGSAAGEGWRRGTKPGEAGAGASVERKEKALRRSSAPSASASSSGDPVSASTTSTVSAGSV